MIKTKLVLNLIGGAFLALSIPLNAESPKSQIPADYPLTTCPVSSDSLGGSMGKPVKVSDNGTDVWLCCSMCKKDFAKEPAKYTKMVQDALAAKSKS